MTAAPMNETQFWTIVENTLRKNDPDERLRLLQSELQKLSLHDIIAFEISFRSYLNKAYTWDLWGAAYIIHGGCSDDGFEYFRRWLVSRGKTAYQSAMENPDSLADLPLEPLGPENYWEFEEFYYVTLDVYQEKGGEGDVREHAEPEAGFMGSGPTGEEFEDDEKHLSKRYPKLWQRFGEEPLPLE